MRTALLLLNPNTREYVCLSCKQLRLDVAGTRTSCGNCNSNRVVFGELNTLNKENYFKDETDTMAKTTTKAAILGKLKKTAKGAYSKARDAAPKAKGAQLPDGLEGAVAQLSSWKMDLDKKGAPYFSITGIVCEPEDCAGMKATVMHFIRESEFKSVQDKLDGLTSDIQLLGGVTAGTEIDDLPDIIDGLVKEKGFFTFNTWRADANSGTYVFIQGTADDYDGEPPEVEIEVETEVEPDGALGELADGGDTGAEAQLTELAEPLGIDPNEYATWVEVEAAIAEQSPEPEEEAEEEYEDVPPWEGLGEQADNEDGDAIDALTTAATEAELDPDEYATWVELEAALAELQSPSEDEVNEEPQDYGGWTPTAGEIYGYKTKPTGDPTDCEVTEVNEAAQTVSLSAVEGGATYSKVSWDLLLDAA